MSDILKESYAHPNALSQNRNYGIIHQGEWPKYSWELYPLAQGYYHEFNPYYVHWIDKEAIISAFKIFTVRDGAFAFADFLVKNVKEMSKWNTHFLVPQAYSPLIPENIRAKCFSYSVSQSQKIDIKKAKSVTVFGLLCEQYFGNIEEVEKKLRPLKDLPKDTRLEVCLNPRRNPLSVDEKENLFYLEIPEIIRKIVGNREIHWVRMKDVFDKTVLKDHLLIDLLHGYDLSCDSYLHFWWLSRGGSVNLIPQTTKEETLFDIDLSFHHKLHVRPLSQTQSLFADLVILTKRSKHDHYKNPLFQTEVNKIISSV